MAIDGIFLNKLINELNIIRKRRINKIYQLSEYDFLINTSDKEHKKLFMSLNPNFPRVHFTSKEYDKPKTPYNFCMFLRKHLEGSVVLDIIQHDVDRVIKIEFLANNELNDKVKKTIVLELISKNTNLILLDENNKILDSLKRTPLDSNRSIRPGVLYDFPDSHGKSNPFDNLNFNLDVAEYEKYKFILDNFMGISPLLAKEIAYKNDLNIISTTVKPTIFDSNNKKDFYFFDFESIEGTKKHYNSLSELLDVFYQQKDIQDRIKQQAKGLDLYIKRQLKKYKKKYIKLQDELVKSNNSEIFKIKGELLLSNIYNFKKGQKSVTLLNYYNNEEIKIDLKENLNPLDNSQVYFKKYQKLKKSIIHLNSQIDITKDEISYFQTLGNQIKFSDLNDVEEIRNELISLKYLKNRKTTKKKIKSSTKSSYTTFKIEDTFIYVGKNNLQNNFITHKLARKEDTWFHTKDMPGSHVVVTKPINELNEVLIRAAANLAAFYSYGENSSSVAVDYTEVRNIKKIPKMKGSLVTYTNQKTMYIDPNYEYILKLNKK